MTVNIPSPARAGANPLSDAAAAAVTAERTLALSYLRAGDRAAVAALFALDARLGAVIRTTREPMVGQMRLTWWHEALTRLGDAPAPAEPVLAAIATELLPRGVRGAALARMIDGWEGLLDGPGAEAEALLAHAQARGEALFAAAGQVIGAAEEPLATAGRGWALADLALHLTDTQAAATARRLARDALGEIMARRWARATRGLGALALLARMDVAELARSPGHPLRVARLLRHRLTGR